MSVDHIYRINRVLFDLPEAHPARQFLCAFVECLQDCAGKEIPFRGREEIPTDQEWFSKANLRNLTFSGFIYEHLCYAVELDGWLSGATIATKDEIEAIERFPYLRTLMQECRDACISDANSAVLAMVEQVENLFDLWEKCITERWQRIGFAYKRADDGV